MRIRIWIFILITVCVRSVHASDAGTSSADFLNLGIGPRAIAMGNAQVGVADDVYAAYWNPAGLVQIDHQQVGFAHAQYVENITEQYAAYALHRPAWGTLAGSISYLNVGKFQGYDAAAQPTTDIGAQDMALGLSYGFSLYHNSRMGAQLAGGVTGKYIRETLDAVSASAYAADTGILFIPGRLWGEYLTGWKSGVVVRNLGSSLRFDQDAFSLPRSITGGLSYTGPVLGQTLTLAMDGQQPAAGSRQYSAGVEVWTMGMLALRTGFISQKNALDGWRMGMGIRFKTLQVDYAFAQAGVFGATHRVGLTLQIGRSSEDPVYMAETSFQSGLKEFRRGRFAEALVHFNKALETDPTHPHALQMMKESYEKIKNQPQ